MVRRQRSPGAGQRPVRLRLELVSRFVQVELLPAVIHLAEVKGRGVGFVDGDAHAQHALVEVARRLDVCHCEYHTIETVSLHWLEGSASHLINGWYAASNGVQVSCSLMRTTPHR